MTGAARLAAEAARRAGAGMVTIAARGSAETYRSGEPGLLVNTSDIDVLLDDDRRKVWVCGPGLGSDEARTIFPALIAAKRIVVGDADVFSAFTGEPDALRGAAVLTPHAGEFARVFDAPVDDRLSAARRASARTDAVVLLKGADTIIAAPRRQGRDQPVRAALAGDGGCRRCAFRHHSRFACARNAALGCCSRRGLPAWAGRRPCRSRTFVEDLLPALIRALGK